MTHIDLEDLGSLAEGRVDPVARARMAEHLAQCRTCMASYADAVRYRAAWMATPVAFDTPPELIAAGLTVTADGPREADILPVVPPIVSPLESQRPVWTSRRNAFASAAACALVAVLISTGDTLLHPWQAKVPAPIRTALESSSGVGLVLPAGERGAASRGPVYRGLASDDPRLESALAGCVERYEAGHTGPAETYATAAGFLVTGQLAAARDLVAEGLRRHPAEPRLLVLAADLARRESDLEQSEQYLREALRLRPRDPIAALDMGLVLADRGRAAEARRSFLSVIAAQPGTPLAQRARRELARL